MNTSDEQSITRDRRGPRYDQLRIGWAIDQTWQARPTLISTTHPRSNHRDKDETHDQGVRVVLRSQVSMNANYIQDRNWAWYMYDKIEIYCKVRRQDPNRYRIIGTHVHTPIHQSSGESGSSGNRVRIKMQMGIRWQKNKARHPH